MDSKLIPAVSYGCRCTLNPGENEGVVRYVLDTYPYVALAPQVNFNKLHFVA